MKLEYTRDLNHNYMIVYPPVTEGRQYALKILETQPVEGTLPMELRHVNGEMLLYYRMDGLQSLEQMCLVKKLGVEDIHSLCRALCAVTEQLKEFLLDEEHLYLSAETIFFDRAKERWLFAADPFGNGTAFPESFGETLVCCADEHDEAASAEAYRIATLTGTQGMRLPEVLGLREAPVCREPQRKLFPEGEYRKREKAAAGETYRAFAWEEEEEKTKRPAVAEEEETPNSRVLTLLCAIATLAGIYLRREYVLSAAGNILTIAVIAVGLAGFASSLVFSGSSGLRSRLSGRGKRRRGGKKARHKASAAKKRGGKRNGTRHRRVRPDAGSVEALFAEPLPGMERYAQDPLSESCDATLDAKIAPGSAAAFPETHTIYATSAGEDDYTRLLTPSAAAAPAARLYSRSAVCNKQISLERFPFTVGKASPSDVTLPEESVSRTHAFLNRDDSGGVTLRDLNSTNGTFRNGIRLKPGEEIVLRRGDEIRFGNLVYEYL